MASSRNAFKLTAVTVAFVFFLTLLPKSVIGGEGLPFSSYSESLKRGKMVLGSKPPGCVDKCFSCRPCMATLVVPSHQKKGFNYKASSSHGDHGDDDDDGYYLLSWKCRCGNKLFQP